MYIYFNKQCSDLQKVLYVTDCGQVTSQHSIKSFIHQSLSLSENTNDFWGQKNWA